MRKVQTQVMEQHRCSCQFYCLQRGEKGKKGKEQNAVNCLGVNPFLLVTNAELLSHLDIICDDTIQHAEVWQKALKAHGIRLHGKGEVKLHLLTRESSFNQVFPNEVFLHRFEVQIFSEAIHSHLMASLITPKGKRRPLGHPDACWIPIRAVTGE